VTNLLPATAYQLERAEPVYETLPGWREELRHCRAFNDLPRAAQDYVRFIEERLESPVRIIGVGPDRAQTIDKES
jgi:adenylosuccinate synthase